MLDRILALALLVGLSGTLQTHFTQALQTAAGVNPGAPRGYILLGAQTLQLLAVGAVTALAVSPRTRWPVLAGLGALVGLLGQGLACLYLGAAGLLLIPAALTTLVGALTYRLLLPAVTAEPTEEGPDA